MKLTGEVAQGPPVNGIAKEQGSNDPAPTKVPLTA